MKLGQPAELFFYPDVNHRDLEGKLHKKIFQIGELDDRMEKCGHSSAAMNKTQVVC